MSSTLIEQARTMHEEMEVTDLITRPVIAHVTVSRFPQVGMNKIVKLLATEAKVLSQVKKIQKSASLLKNSYEDKDEGKKHEVAAMSGSEVFGGFYSRLRELREYHRKFPNLYYEPDNNEDITLEDDPEILDKFSGEEMHGRFLDLNENHIQFINLKNARAVSYEVYLNIFLDFASVPLNVKGMKYKNYLKSLKSYLVNFLERAQPLVDFATPMKNAEDEALAKFAKNGSLQSEQPGIGLFFHESGGRIRVKTIVSGGSAERDGRVQVGDILIAIDGTDVRGQSANPNVFRNMITGPEGSTVRLKMLRGEGSNAFGYELELVRGSPEYFARLEQEKRNEDELTELKLQLKQALAEEQQVAEEVDRIKRLLISERQDKEMRDKDVAVLEQTFDEDKQQLTEALRKVETVKRDVEARLAPVQAREQELSEELSRQIEKDRLRKEYIEELQKRHEERKIQLEQQLQLIRKQAAMMLEKKKAEHDALWKQRQLEEERELFREMLENSDSLAGYVHEMQARMNTINAGFFDGMPQFGSSSSSLGAARGLTSGQAELVATSTPPNKGAASQSYPDQYFLA
ncbi:hypothetical protein GUITHDRAFT_146427 [Guillardia theta CCMP2712]|uniref:PDZ domain-containing protein n=1 Tax=Guillardia theta (strain CCMP2712) TaxID=905079 RepID=L1IGY8_GUITC|nr:hypothetical protein GUITHDRAFT_146427 [Guillardia theta CCMP2712]EKX35503.1 hypothetical protein GUITHDRAFT_146427 [Guillardia theta CCMP2712]|eukprot:XP_005822483.1 hypothetical protein GUITHDRAFT_146427 [Guillardia theta CCMP2712]